MVMVTENISLLVLSHLSFTCKSKYFCSLLLLIATVKLFDF